MKVRHIFGIIILAIAALFLSPAILVSGFTYPASGPELPFWLPMMFAVPAAVLILAGMLTVGPPHRLFSAGCTALAGAAFSALALLSMYPMMRSPAWQDMMRASGEQQGLPPQAIAMQLQLSLELPIPLLAITVLGLLGLAGIWPRLQKRRRAAAHDQLVPNVSDPGGEALSTAGPAGRPVSITILAWSLLVSSFFSSLVMLPWSGDYSVGLNAAATFMGVAPGTYRLVYGTTMCLYALGSYFLLRRANWARWLILMLGIAGALTGLFWLEDMRWSMLPALVWIGASVYLLFWREPARRYFGSVASG